MKDHSDYIDIRYEDEKLPVIVVDHFPDLGKVVALRFLEWVQQNPEGVISLPTGKTPEHFINWVQHLQQNWTAEKSVKLLEDHAIDPSIKPQMRGLRFVQIDEFYPIDSSQSNSFFSYIHKYYIDGFGLDPDRALMMDCHKIGLLPGQKLHELWVDDKIDLSLRHHDATTHNEMQQKEALTRIDEWCQEYETQIRDMGGLGFFLGGIGPDGHIGFNVRGSSHYSTTRLTKVNYETQAAAAGDLGGIEVAREKKVITIGLNTITYNKDCLAIIMAAGEAKAKVIAENILSEPSPKYPATALQVLPNACFYLTRGATKQLGARLVAEIEALPEFNDEKIEKVMVDVAVNANKRILDLKESDFKKLKKGEILLKRCKNWKELRQKVTDSLISKIERGIATYKKTKFLHTEPHHDDIMLGYLPQIARAMREGSNEHHFATLTSGFTAVTNDYLRRALSNLKSFMQTDEFEKLYAENYFDPNDKIARNRDIWRYLDGLAAQDEEDCQEGESRRLLRNFHEAFELRYKGDIERKINELIEYFDKSYPGQRDSEIVQVIKGMCREWEAECLWAYFGWNSSNVYHLRLGFYKGKLFTEEPQVDRDIPPILDMLDRIRPDIVSLAFDPEASGPDTHYKVMQAIRASLEKYVQHESNENLKIWGYRNVWFRFHPSEANIFVPVSLNMFALMENAFMNTYISQKEASFPSYEYDGPFCGLAQKIQVDQYTQMKICLGREWFYENPNPLIRATRGLVFLKEMSYHEFKDHCLELKKVTENL